MKIPGHFSAEINSHIALTIYAEDKQARDAAVKKAMNELNASTGVTLVRRRVDGVTTFNRLRGGEYMFMPSISALRWIGSKGWAE